MLDVPERFLESLVLHLFLVDLSDEFAKLRAHLQHVLEGLEDVRQVQEALFEDGVKVLVMQHPDFFKVT